MLNHGESTLSLSFRGPETVLKAWAGRTDLDDVDADSSWQHDMMFYVATIIHDPPVVTGCVLDQAFGDLGGPRYFRFYADKYYITGAFRPPHNWEAI